MANSIGVEMREEFIDICNKLCSVTTVAQYLQLKQQMDDMAKIYPLKKWIKWWHGWRSHIFLPYGRSGIPMVNLSEQRNKLIKPPHTMRLVHAAKYDAAVMMFQAKQLELYGMNMLTVDLRGANQAAKEENDRHEQLVVATDFNNIVDNEEDVETEVMECVDPVSYVPKNYTKHKPPKINTNEVPTGDASTQHEVCGHVWDCGCGHGIAGTTRGRGLRRGRGRGRLVLKRRIHGAVEEKRSLEESI